MFGGHRHSAACVVDLSGTKLQQLPKSQFSIGATQVLPIGENSLSLHLDYAYVSSQVFYATQAAAAQPAAVKAAYDRQNALGKLSGYGLFSGRAGFTFNDGAAEVYLYGRNLAGKKYLTSSFAELYRDLGFSIEYPGAPRTYGIGLSYKFGR